MHICVRVCAHECRYHGGQKRSVDPLELEVWLDVSSLVEVLGTELSPQQEQVLLVAEPPLQFPK